jgi:hypothetical protein
VDGRPVMDAKVVLAALFFGVCCGVFLVLVAAAVL